MADLPYPEIGVSPEFVCHDHANARSQPPAPGSAPMRRLLNSDVREQRNLPGLPA